MKDPVDMTNWCMDCGKELEVKVYKCIHCGSLKTCYMIDGLVKALQAQMKPKVKEISYE